MEQNNQNPRDIPPPPRLVRTDSLSDYTHPAPQQSEESQPQPQDNTRNDEPRRETE